MPVFNLIFFRSSSWPSFLAAFMTFIFSLGPVSSAWPTNQSERTIARVSLGPIRMGGSNDVKQQSQQMRQPAWIPNDEELYQQYHDAHFGDYVGGLSEKEIVQKQEEKTEKFAAFKQSLREILDNKTSRQEEIGKHAKILLASEIEERLYRLRSIEDIRQSEKDEVQPRDIQERRDRIYHLAVTKIMDELSSLREDLGPHFQKHLTRLQNTAVFIDEDCLNNEFLIAEQKNANKNTESSWAFNHNRQGQGSQASKPGGIYGTGPKDVGTEEQDIKGMAADMTAMAKEIKKMNAKCQKKFKDLKGSKLLQRALRGNFEPPDFDDGKNSVNAISSDFDGLGQDLQPGCALFERSRLLHDVTSKWKNKGIHVSGYGGMEREGNSPEGNCEVLHMKWYNNDSGELMISVSSRRTPISQGEWHQFLKVLQKNGVVLDASIRIPTKGQPDTQLAKAQLPSDANQGRHLKSTPLKTSSEEKKGPYRGAFKQAALAIEPYYESREENSSGQ